MLGFRVFPKSSFMVGIISKKTSMYIPLLGLGTLKNVKWYRQRNRLRILSVTKVIFPDSLALEVLGARKTSGIDLEVYGLL